jgi:alpha-1,3-mannosyltransferase
MCAAAPGWLRSARRQTFNLRTWSRLCVRGMNLSLPNIVDGSRSERLSILHICRQYTPSVGGVERFVSQLASRQAAQGHTVAVATLNRVWRSRDRLPAHELIDQVPVHRLPFAGGPFFFIAPAVLSLAGGFDLLHVHNTDFFLDYLTATRWLHRRPLVVSTHGGFFHTHPQSRVKALYFRWITRRSLGAASAVIPNSLGDERRFGPHGRLSVRVDNAIDYPAFAGVARQPEIGRLVTIGRLSENKNVAGLLKVFAAARAVTPGLRLVVVGDGPLRPELEALAARLAIADVVIWRGAVDDAALRDELARADFFLSAAQYEGFGLAVVEAMAAGVPVFVNRIEAFEALVEDGRSGFLAHYDRSEEAGRRLAGLVSLPDVGKRQVGATARAQAARYGWDAALPKFERIYRDALLAARAAP